MVAELMYMSTGLEPVRMGPVDTTPSRLAAPVFAVTRWITRTFVVLSRMRKASSALAVMIENWFGSRPPPKLMLPLYPPSGAEETASKKLMLTLQVSSDPALEDEL